MSLDSSTYLILLLSLCGITVWFFLRTFSALHKKRLIEDTPTSLIRSASQGYTELIGYGQPMDGEPITSPLSGRECLWFRIKTERIWGTSPLISYLYRVFHFLFQRPLAWFGYNTAPHWESDHLFYLQDETGYCVIDPENAQIKPSVSRYWYGNSAIPDRGPALTGNALNHKYKYSEELLEKDDHLYALGDLHTLGGTATLRDMKAEVLDLLKRWKMNYPQLLKNFDRNNDGLIDEKEWEQVRISAAQQITTRHRENDLPPSVSILRHSNDPRRPTIISSTSLQEVIKNYRLQTSLALSACLFSASLILCLLIIRG